MACTCLLLCANITWVANDHHKWWSYHNNSDIDIWMHTHLVLLNSQEFIFAIMITIINLSQVISDLLSCRLSVYNFLMMKVTAVDLHTSMMPRPLLCSLLDFQKHISVWSSYVILFMCHMLHHRIPTLDCYVWLHSLTMAKLTTLSPLYR